MCRFKVFAHEVVHPVLYKFPHRPKHPTDAQYLLMRGSNILLGRSLTPSCANNCYHRILCLLNYPWSIVWK